MKKALRLPKKFKEYFWDVDFKKISFKPFNKYVLERIMNLGDFDALKWLLKEVPKSAIEEVLKTGRELDKKTRNYWRVVYGK